MDSWCCLFLLGRSWQFEVLDHLGHGGLCNLSHAERRISWCTGLRKGAHRKPLLCRIRINPWPNAPVLANEKMTGFIVVSILDEHSWEFEVLYQLESLAGSSPAKDCYCPELTVVKPCFSRKVFPGVFVKCLITEFVQVTRFLVARKEYRI